MSLIGPSRHFTAMQRFGGFRTEADIRWQVGPTGSVENDPLGDLGLVGRHAQTYFNLWLICAGCSSSSRSGWPGGPGPPAPSLGAAFDQAVVPLLRCHLR